MSLCRWRRCTVIVFIVLPVPFFCWRTIYNNAIVGLLLRLAVTLFSNLSFFFCIFAFPFLLSFA